jgi:hypothetical protein
MIMIMIIIDNIGMMMFDAVLYLLAALYLDHTLPTQYGATHHPLWCLPSWLRPGARKLPRPLDAELLAEVARGAPAVLESDPLEFATTANNSYDGIHVCELVKTYGSGAARKVSISLIPQPSSTAPAKHLVYA